MSEAAFDIYLMCCAVLALNLWFLVFVIGNRRIKAKAFARAEDANAVGVKLLEQDIPTVQRAKDAHRNALENIPIFMILGLLYLMSGGSEIGAMAYFVTFTVSRWLHTIVFLAGLQPWRTLLYTVGLFVNIGLTAQLLVAALS